MESLPLQRDLWLARFVHVGLGRWGSHYGSAYGDDIANSWYDIRITSVRTTQPIVSCEDMDLHIYGYIYVSRNSEHYKQHQ